MKAIMAFVLFSLSWCVYAEEMVFINTCDDEEALSLYREALSEPEDDPLVVRLYSLRYGICKLIAEGKLELEIGSRIFDQEQLRAIDEWIKEMEKRNERNSS